MTNVETLKEKIVRLKKKLTETKKEDKVLVRAVAKSLKRAQRKINTLTGRKLAAKHKGEESEKKPAGAPAAVKPAVASAPAAAKPAPAPAPAAPAPEKKQL